MDEAEATEVVATIDLVEVSQGTTPSAEGEAEAMDSMEGFQQTIPSVEADATDTEWVAALTEHEVVYKNLDHGTVASRWNWKHRKNVVYLRAWRLADKQPDSSNHLIDHSRCM